MDNWTSEQVKCYTAATGVLMMSLFSKILILPSTVTPVQSDETKITNNQNQCTQSGQDQCSQYNQNQCSQSECWSSQEMGSFPDF